MACIHPQSAQYFDRVRGQTSCTLCGEVLTDQHFELDPAFARGERGGGGGAAGRSAGFARPSRPAGGLGSHGLSRPSIEAARRQLTAIARKLCIPPAHIDIAAGIFKMAVTVHAVVGGRTAVLCACLYIVCRRQPEATPLTVLDFADYSGDSPFAIISYMRTICKATSTTLPPVEPVFLVVRLVNHLDLGAQSSDIAVYAMKVMRAMRNDWIETGRRPLGVAAAALIVACQVFGVETNLEELAALVRLNQFTIVSRIEEFAATPAAMLTSIDDYDTATAGQTTAPGAFLRGRKLESEYVIADDMRGLANLVYELINDAKEQAPPTPERQAKWRRFIEAKSASSGAPMSELQADLAALSPQQQLIALGAVARRVKPEVKAEPPRTQDLDDRLLESVAKARELVGTEAAVAIQQVVDSAAEHQPSEAGGAKRVVRRTSDGHDAHEEELVLSDGSDIEDEYVIYDNEARLRTERANKSAFKEEWERVGLRVAAALTKRAGIAGTRGQPGSKRERGPAAASALDSMRRALRSRGGGNIDLAQLEQLIPGVSNTDALDLDSLLGPAPAGKPTESSAASNADDFADEWLVE